jgi:hypothetical protein
MARVQKIVAEEKEPAPADIVFCVDATGSMQPCFEGLRSCIMSFVEGLQSATKVDFRLRLLAYRDCFDHEDKEPWEYCFDFASSFDEFCGQLRSVKPKLGGDNPESTLDALYRAIHSNWRERVHKTIVLFTDDDAHPKMHPLTYNRPDDPVKRIIQDFQTLRNVMLYMVVPEYPIYQQLERAAKHADRQITAEFVPVGDERYKGLTEVNWDDLLRMLGETISQTSLIVAQQQ